MSSDVFAYHVSRKLIKPVALVVARDSVVLCTSPLRLRDMSLSWLLSLCWLTSPSLLLTHATSRFGEKGDPVTISYDDVQCLKYSYKMTMNLGATSKTRNFGFKAEVSRAT